ncbi:EamA/RhaT family transporter [Tropicimonas aquimaris]|uniref:EamA/RhaT family transporter n=1 Tax=Tropicimonas aquimaris TaxID=914152 RepID=A0ABW3ISW0_9RHOB
MFENRITAVATAIVIATGALWGFYWLPVRSLMDLGLGGAWGTVAITLGAALLLAPLALADLRQIARAGPVVLISIALGGAAFALYSIGFVYGRVAIIILLYFLTPVWSTLIGRFVMGWMTPRLRYVAIGVGLLGLGVMLGAEGVVPIPRGLGEWMALAAGILWSVATTGIRAKSELGAAASSFVFALGGLAASLILALALSPLPTLPQGTDLLKATGIALLTGGLWWGLSLAGLMWAAVRLEPARVGLLLMMEVLVGAVSAAVLAGETLHPLEIVGGALVLCAGILEVWPVRPRRTTQAR